MLIWYPVAGRAEVLDAVGFLEALVYDAINAHGRRTGGPRRAGCPRAGWLSVSCMCRAGESLEGMS